MDRQRKNRTVLSAARCEYRKDFRNRRSCGGLRAGSAFYAAHYPISAKRSRGGAGGLIGACAFFRRNEIRSGKGYGVFGLCVYPVEQRDNRKLCAFSAVFSSLSRQCGADRNQPDFAFERIAFDQTKSARFDELSFTSDFRHDSRQSLV